MVKKKIINSGKSRDNDDNEDDATPTGYLSNEEQWKKRKVEEKKLETDF